MVKDLVPILGRNRIFEFGSLESIVTARTATFDSQDRLIAADPHAYATLRIGRQIALPVMFALARLFTPNVRLDQIFVFAFLRHNSPRISKTGVTP